MKLASLVNISHSYLEHILQNDRNFREDELQKILPFLSININSGYFTPQNTIHGKFITLPRKSSAKLMQIIGYLLGDGTVQPRTIRFKDTDREVLEVYQKSIEELFNIKGRVVPQNGTIAYLLEVNSVYLSKWLKENIISQKKEFLRKVENQPREEIVAFLRGIFDAEGSISLSARQVNLRLTDKTLVRLCQSLLLRLGIPASFCKIGRQDQRWKDCYSTHFSNRRAFKKFRDIIGFSSQKKDKKLKSLIAKGIEKLVSSQHF